MSIPCSCWFSASRRGGSDDSQERLRPRKQAGKQPVYEDTSSPEGSYYEEEMEYEERAEDVVVRANVPKPGTQKPSYMPPPPPNQPPGDARCISFEPPPSLGHEIKDFTLVSKAAYLKFRRDVDQFSAEHDSMDSRFRTNVQADIFTIVIVPKGLSVHHYVNLEHIRTHPMKYLGAIELIESSVLAANFIFQHNHNHAAIHQFYATCFFGTDKTIT